MVVYGRAGSVSVLTASTTTLLAMSTATTMATATGTMVHTEKPVTIIMVSVMGRHDSMAGGPMVDSITITKAHGIGTLHLSRWMFIVLATRDVVHATLLRVGQTV